MRSLLIVVASVLPTACHFAGHLSAQVPGYPEGVVEAKYKSDGDGTLQPTLQWFPKTDSPVPLLVALHTWSSDFRQAGGEAEYAKWCQQAGWAFVHPNFRGINKTPQALGSDLAVADIRSVVRYAKSKAEIDSNRIYCIGVSGGGHASMLVAARAPEIWAGVSAWCGISDIARWHDQCDQTQFARYSTMIESALGGSPKESAQAKDAAWHRSPLKWIPQASQLPPLDINHGINDGRAGSVPVTHSINAFNAAVGPKDTLPNNSIAEFYRTQSIPPTIADRNEAKSDPLYGLHQPVFRVTSGTTRLTIFQGGHEIVHHAALNWLSAQAKGQNVTWKPKQQFRLESTSDSTKSGK